MSNHDQILTRDDIAAMAGVDKTHFLNPGARRRNKSLGDATGLTGFGFHIIEVAPGDATSEHHMHHQEEECVYILEGQATAIIGEDSFAVGPGDFIGYPKGGLAHSIRNTGAGVLRCIVAGQRLPNDVCDYPQAGKRLYRNPGMAWNVVDFTAISEPGGTVGKK